MSSRERVFLTGTVIFFVSLCVHADPAGGKLGKRITCPIPLMRLGLIDDNTAVRISRNGSEDYAVVAELSDHTVENSRSTINRTTYHEPADKAYIITDFEARQLLAVTKSFIETLEMLEKHLQNERWGQCLYLDAFLPKFLRDYIMLIGISRNAASKYHKKTLLFCNEFDVSLQSPRSDMRLATWRNNPDYIVKLRISIKELIYQLKLWEKRELSDSRRNPELWFGAKSEESLELFIRIYFSLGAQSDLQGN